MRATESEIDMLANQPDDFAALASDTCDKQVSTVKWLLINSLDI